MTPADAEPTEAEGYTSSALGDVRWEVYELSKTVVPLRKDVISMMEQQRQVNRRLEELEQRFTQIGEEFQILQRVFARSSAAGAAQGSSEPVNASTQSTRHVVPVLAHRCKCLSYTCPFYAHEDIQYYGGYCCGRCFYNLKNPKHGKNCTSREVPADFDWDGWTENHSKYVAEVVAATASATAWL